MQRQLQRGRQGKPDNPYYAFTGQESDCGSASHTAVLGTTATMNAAHTCRAQFALATYMLRACSKSPEQQSQEGQMDEL